MKILLSFFMLLALTSCASHSHKFKNDHDIGALNSHPLIGKKIAFDFNQVPNEYRQRANGHKYHITGIRDSVSQISRDFFKNEKIVEHASEADAILVLKLVMKMSGAAFGTSCTSDATWEIQSPAGKQLSVGQASSKSSIPSMPAGGQNCEISFLKAVPEALDNAMSKLR